MRLYDIQVNITALNAADKIQVAQQAQLQAAAAQQMLHLKHEVTNKEHAVSAAVEEKATAGINERTPHNSPDSGQKHNQSANSGPKQSSEKPAEPVKKTAVSDKHIIDIKA